MSKPLITMAAAGAFAILASLPTPTAQGLEATLDGFDLAVGADGDIQVPELDYRRDWTLLGSWSVAADDGDGAQGMHNVYTQPEAVDAYRRTGSFPDGTVLIKELFSTLTEEMTTGTVSRAGETAGWFVMVKDANGRFDGNALWGDGWGWSFFSADDSTVTTSTDYVADCMGCHVPAQDTDWIYVQGYPVLSE
jgi:hypothetical protein